jgi:hypothetical protein
MTRIMGIGPWCITTDILKAFGLRHQAYPFDWIFSSAAMVLHAIQDKFELFMDKTYLTTRPDLSFVHTCHQKYIDMIQTKEMLYHFQQNEDGLRVTPMFNHHNLLESDTYAAFQRRCHRFMEELMDDTTPIILVYTSANGQYKSDMKDLQALAALYPHVDVLCMVRDCDNSQLVGTIRKEGQVYVGFYYTVWASHRMPKELFEHFVPYVIQDSAITSYHSSSPSSSLTPNESPSPTHPSSSPIDP